MNRYDPFTFTLTGMMPFALVIALIIAYPLSLWLLGRYRAAVSKAMAKNSRQGNNENSTGASPADNNIALTTAPPFENLSPGSPLGVNKIVYRRPWLSALMHFIAGLIFALLMAFATLLSQQLSLSTMRISMYAVVYFWPVVICIALVATITMRQYLIIFGGYLFLFLIVAAIAISRSPNSSWLQIFNLWNLLNSIPSIALLLVISKQTSAVGPLVFVFLFITIMGGLAFHHFVVATPSLMKFVIDIAVKIGIGGYMTTFLLFATGFLLFAIPGWALIRIVKTRYKNKKTGDQAIMLSTVWIVFGFVYSMSLVWDGKFWVLIGFSIVFIYLLLTRLMEKWLCAKYTFGDGSSLLFLRVFALGKRSKNLFSRVSKYRRFNGSIQLISGPDLFNATLEPHEFFDFITGKLARRFIHNAEDLAIRIAEMDKKPDADGRYRVNDFFCHNDTWKMVLSSLVHQSRIILMDLRSFGKNNKGCQYEISELLNLISFTRILFVTDKTTDQAFLKITLEQSFHNLRADSPNKPYGYEQLRIFSFNNDNFSALLRELYTAPVACCL
jgi:hypothetical protein